MGQSQLLMIVLAVIIIGIAVTVGITQFGESAMSANRDAVANDCTTIISKAQTWYRKPTSMGGGGNSFDGVTLPKLGVAASNDNGSYVLSEGDTDVTCVGTGKEDNSAGTAKLTVTITYSATNDSTTYADTM